MKKIHTLFFALTLSSFSNVVFSQQNIVYKCTDANGIVSYLNIVSLTKKQNCQKTDLGDGGGNMIIRNERTEKSFSSSTTAPALLNNDDQKKRDEGRAAILGKELEDEQAQLKNVEQMLKNVSGTKDTDQISKLTQMQETHTKNISALKKELGIKE